LVATCFERHLAQRFGDRPKTVIEQCYHYSSSRDDGVFLHRLTDGDDGGEQFFVVCFTVTALDVILSRPADKRRTVCGEIKLQRLHFSVRRLRLVPRRGYGCWHEYTLSTEGYAE
jgi:hypothetical protein